VHSFVSGTAAGLHALVEPPTSAMTIAQTALDAHGLSAYSLRRYYHDGKLPAQFDNGLWLVPGFGEIRCAASPTGLGIAEAIRSQSGPAR
jgi:hypothetical protein